MKYNNYNANCPKVSKIGFGAWQLGKSNDWKAMTDKEAMELVHKALDLGVNFFDTAPNYGLGSSESRLGLALSGKDRTKIVINTKFGHNDNGQTNFEAENIRPSLEGSLRRLKTDYVDSIIIHNPPFSYLDGNKNDHYEILERLKDEGKLKAYGASLDTTEEIKLFLSTTKAEVIEAFFNVLHQEVRKAFNQTLEKGVSIIAKIPLDSGWLSGQYDENSTFNDIRKRWSKEDIKIRAELVNQIKEIIPKDENIAQIAISYCSAYDAVSTVIPGNKNIKQLIQNVESINNPISNELVQKLEDFYNKKVEMLRLPW